MSIVIDLNLKFTQKTLLLLQQQEIILEMNLLFLL